MLRKDTIAGNGAFSFFQFTQANSGCFSLLSVSACKDTIQGNVWLGNWGTSLDMRDDSVSCLILRDGLAYYCASINREERPIFVVKLNENDNKDRTKEPKGAYNPRNSLNVSIFCLFVLKKYVIINYLFDITYDNRTTL